MTINNKNSNINDLDLSWRNLSVVQVDFVEMDRQRQKLDLLYLDASSRIKTLASAVSKLASLVGSGFSIAQTDLDQIDEIADISQTMVDQLSQMEGLNDSIKDELSEMVSNLLFAYVPMTDENGNTLYDDDGNIIYMRDAEGDLVVKSVYNITDGEESINYNAILKRNQFYRALFADKTYSEILEEMATNTTYLKQTYDFYGVIESKYQVSSGEEFINDILSDIQNADGLSNREKSVISALVLNKVCYDNNVTLPYVPKDVHGNFDFNNLQYGSDCSEYCSTLIKLSNSDFQGGGTGSLSSPSVNPTTPCEFSELEPGDLIIMPEIRNAVNEIVRPGHVRFYLGQAANGKYIFTENESGVGVHISTYSEDKLGEYTGYKVNYGDNASNSSVGGTQGNNNYGTVTLSNNTSSVVTSSGSTYDPNLEAEPVAFNYRPSNNTTENSE